MKYYAVFSEEYGYLCGRESERGFTRFFLSFEDQPILYRTRAGAVRASQGLDTPDIEEVEVAFAHRPPLDDCLPGMEENDAQH